MLDPFTLLLSFLNLVIVVAIILHIRDEARRIGEPWAHMILLVVFFWWLVYPLWLLLWPGLHRDGRQGRNPENFLRATWARKRIERACSKNDQK